MNTSTQMHNNGDGGKAAGSGQSRGELDEMARKRKDATIIRAPKDRDHPYKSVRRATIEDPRLSWEERGLLSYLLVKPDDWEISIPALIKGGSAGKNKIYTMIAHLEELRYLERQEIREKGRFVGVRLLLHEVPLPENGETVEQEPLPENRDTVDNAPLPENREMATRVAPFPDLRYPVKPLPVNRTHTNKEYSTKKEQSTNNEEKKGNDGLQPSPPFEDFVSELCVICYGHKETATLTEKDIATLRAEAKKIRGGGFTVGDMRAWMTGVWFKDWKWKKGQQRPTPAVVRSTIAQVRVEVDELPRIKYSQDNT